MPRIDVHDLAVHVQQAGHGDDIVLIHGLGADLASWYLGVMPLLAQTFRVTAFDLRGHGLTTRTPTGYTSEQLAEDLIALLDRLGIDEPAVVGHSYGGAVALHGALLTPHRISAVVAADAYLPCYEGRRDVWRDVRARRAAGRLRRRGVEVPSDVARITYGMVEDLARHGVGTEVPESGFPAGVSVRMAHERWIRLREATSVVGDVRTPVLTAERLTCLAAPVLAVYGERSTCRASLRGLRLAIPDLEVVVVPEVGHLHPLLRPELFADSVRTFVERRKRHRHEE